MRYGLVIRFRLLSTFPHGNAVTTVNYRPVTLAWEGLAPSWSNAFTGALAITLRRDVSPSPPSGSLTAEREAYYTPNTTPGSHLLRLYDGIGRYELSAELRDLAGGVAVAAEAFTTVRSVL